MDGRADQYALGCLAYRLLAGEVPFDGEESIAVMVAHLEAPPPSLRERRPDLPAAADRVLAKALAKAPDQRYDSCGEFADALRDALGVAPYQPRHPGRHPTVAAPSRPAARPDVAPTVADAWPPPGPMPSLRPMPSPASLAATGPVAPPGPEVRSRPSGAPGPSAATRPAGAPGPVGTPGPSAATRPAGAPGPVGAPGPPVASHPAKASRPPVQPPAGQDKPHQAWPGPDQEGAPWPAIVTGRRRGRAGTAVRVGAPSAVLVAAVAVILVAVTGHHAGSSSSVNDNVAAPGCAGAFAGYPGQQGDVTVNSVAAAGSTRLAVGGADGHPAIWRCRASGGWQLLPATAAAALRGAGSFTSVAFGPRGWIAAGMGGPGTAAPVAMTSADGVTWKPVDTATAFTGPGACVAAVAAGPDGYVTVGKHVSGHRVYAAMWWSAGLGGWAQGDNDRGGRLDGRVRSSAVDGVARTPVGFVAAGTHGPGGIIWTSTDGQAWTIAPGAGIPAGAFLLVAASGSRVVVAGYSGTPGDGATPVVMVSTDGGQHWNSPVTLDAAGGHGTVTALSATGSGFTARGELGQAGARHAVSWRSPDGVTWSKAAPAGGGANQATAMSAAADAATANTATAATSQCAAP